MEANKKIKFVIFASGRGSNAKNILEHIKKCTQEDKEFSVSVCCLLTDNADAPVIEMAKQYDVPIYVVPFQRNGDIAYNVDKLDHEERIRNVLGKYAFDYILLCGYMRILSEDFVNRFTIVNIHPSLLPLFPGKDGYGDAFKAGVPESGVTIHYVDEGVDSGAIILQKKFPRKQDDSLDSFKERGLELEHSMFREFIDDLNFHKTITTLPPKRD